MVTRKITIDLEWVKVGCQGVADADHLNPHLGSNLVDLAETLAPDLAQRWGMDLEEELAEVV